MLSQVVFYLQCVLQRMHWTSHLSAENVDICDVPFDHDPADLNYLEKLDYTKTLAFQNLNYYINPSIYEFSDIDTPPSHHATSSRC